MMRPFPWSRLAPLALSPMIASCAGSPSSSTVAPPRLTLAEVAERPCALAVLPPQPTRADLDAAYVTRGAQIVSCDAARRLAVETLMAERALLDRWREPVGGSERRGWRWFRPTPRQD